MLAVTVRHGSRPACWKAMPYSWSSRACRAVLPKTLTVPAVGASRSAMSRRSVLLPHPDGPMSETNSPGATVTLTSLRAAMGAPFFDGKTRSTAVTSTAIGP
jgi:hypothetical protein